MSILEKLIYVQRCCIIRAQLSKLRAFFDSLIFLKIVIDLLKNLVIGFKKRLSDRKRERVNSTHLSRTDECTGGQGGEVNREISEEVEEGGDVENLHMEAVNGPECIQRDFKLIMELCWQKLEADVMW